MDILYAFSLMAIWMVAVIAARFVSTFIHEMGHAIPALAFTKDEVAVFIGSYGEKPIERGFGLGRLKFLLGTQITKFNMGMCAYRGPSSAGQNLLIALGGPIASLLGGVVVILFLANTNLSDGAISLWAILAFSCIWDFVVNIIPDSNPQMLGERHVLHNDGAQIQKYWQERKIPKSLNEARSLAAENQPEEASSLMEDVISSGHHSKVAYRELLDFQYQAKQFNEALETFEKFAHRHKLAGPDHYLLGKIQLEKGDNENALRSARAATHLDHVNAHYLILQGKALIQLGEFATALKKFNASIQYNPNLFSGYTGRSLAHVRLDQMENALSDLETANKMESENAELHLHYGLYYQALGQKLAAKRSFEKAKELGSTYHGLDYFIEDLRERTNW